MTRLAVRFTVFVSLLAASALLLSACGDDDDESGDCASNARPELLELTVFADGEPVEQPVHLGEVQTISLQFEYADADCNLAHGFVTMMQDREGFMSYGFPDDTPCSSAEAGGPYRVDGFSPCRVLDGDSCSSVVYLEDDCGARSNWMLIEMVEGE